LLTDDVPPTMRALQVPLYLFNNFQIIMIVWQTLSYSRHKLLEQEPYDILLAIMGAIGQVCSG
jgi:sodium/bile acid cotransporter 7